ncbi:SCO2521 family protein [Streptomyces sp. NPDC050528]|uniref:SCO2521 family protein n=1 Tax=unclassified Streptomyces TaxID=2593676 RepID=UPI003790AD28
MTGGFAMVGEIRTVLLTNARALPPQTVAALLDLVPGAPVRVRERPLRRALSPDLLHGVDCPLITRPGARVNSVGTLAARAVVTGGRVAQGSARAVLDVGGERRLPWSHYMARPGIVELNGRAAPSDVAARFPAGRDPDSLDPGAVGEALLDRLRDSPLLDRRPPLRARRTRLRWSATVGADRFSGAFTLADQEVRTLRLTLTSTDTTPDQLVSLCEDLALHDWLLTTVSRVVEHDRGRLDDLRTTVEQLLHLWLPGIDLPPELLAVWEGLERAPGLSRQWHAQVERIRHRLTLRALNSPQSPA